MREIKPGDPIYDAYRILAEGRLAELPTAERDSVEEVIEDDVLSPDRYMTMNSGEWVEWHDDQCMTRGQVELSPHQFAAVFSDDGVQDVAVHAIRLRRDGVLEDRVTEFQMVFGRRVKGQ